MRRTLGGVAVGLVMGLTLAGGTAVAATGGSFILGRANSASTQTTLTNSGGGPVLGLSTRSGQPPLAVSAGAGKATNLNADRLDGLDGSQLQRATRAACADGFWLDVVTPTGGFNCMGAVYDFVAVDTTTDSAGIARVACRDGYASLAGGYALPSGTKAVSNGTVLYADDDGTEGHSARFLALDGTPYVGDVAMTVTCVTVDSQSALGARQRSGPTKPAPLR